MLKFNLDRLISDTEAQDLVEYALIFACVGLGAVAGANGVAANVTSALNTIATHFTSNI